MFPSKFSISSQLSSNISVHQQSEAKFFFWIEKTRTFRISVTIFLSKAWYSILAKNAQGSRVFPLNFSAELRSQTPTEAEGCFKMNVFFLRMNKLRYLNSFQKFSISNWSISYDIYRRKMLFSIVICNKMVWFSRNWEFIHCLFCQRLLLTAI